MKNRIAAVRWYLFYASANLVGYVVGYPIGFVQGIKRGLAKRK